MRLLGGLIILGVLAGCATIQNGTRALSGNRQTFDGQYYSARLDTDDVRPEVFVVSVGNLDRGIEGALEAGRYEANSHCLRTYGLSDIEWANGPDMPQQALRIVDGKLLLSGECVGWI